MASKSPSAALSASAGLHTGPRRRLTAMAAGFLAVGAWAVPARAQPVPYLPIDVPRTVTSGAQSRVWFVWGLQPDCSTRRGFNVRIARLPAHGTASLAKTNEVVAEDWIHPSMGRRKRLEMAYCIGRTAPVINVFYKSKPGFRGSDSMAVVITNAFQTRQRVVSIQVDVR